MNTQLIKSLAMTTTLFFTSFCLSSNGSGYGELRFDTMQINSKSEKLNITISNMIHGKIGIELKLNGEEIRIDPNYLFGAELIERQSVSLKVGPMNPNQPAVRTANELGFYITFKFGGTYEHGKENEGVEVQKFIRLHFKDGKFLFSELYSPLGEFKNKWKISDRWPDSVNNSTSEFEGITIEL